MRLEVYCERASEAGDLARKFGGQVRTVTAESWQPPPATAPGRPLAIGGRLWVTGRTEELLALRAAHPGKACPVHPGGDGVRHGGTRDDRDVLALFAIFERAGRPMRGVPLLFAAVIVTAALLGWVVAVAFAEPMNLAIRRGGGVDRRPLGGALSEVD